MPVTGPPPVEMVRDAPADAGQFESGRPDGRTERTVRREVDYAVWVETHVPLIRRLTARAALRSRLPFDDRDELLSRVFLKLVSDDYAVLRAFEGRSSISTYLSSVIRRVCLDLWVSRAGKYRPTARLMREGPVAIAIAAMMRRHGLDLEQACRQYETTSGARLPEMTRRRLPATISAAPSRQFVPLDDVSLAAPGPPCQDGDDQDVLEAGRRIRRALSSALQCLSRSDRLLLALKFSEAMPISKIARDLAVEQKPLYGRFKRIYELLKTSLVRSGVTLTDVRQVVGRPIVDISLLLEVVSPGDRQEGPRRPDAHRASQAAAGESFAVAG
jgi:RNA polymerase sigma factor (sigma-70 family)